MAEEKPAPEQDPWEGSRETVERELRRSGNEPVNDRNSAPREQQRDNKIAIPSPMEPGDQNAQTTPPSI